MTNIGENLTRARKRARLSQAQLGELISRGTRSIMHYEKGERSAPFEVIERWAEVTGVTVEELRTGNKPEIPTITENTNNPTKIMLDRLEKLAREIETLNRENSHLKKANKKLTRQINALIGAEKDS